MVNRVKSIAETNSRSDTLEASGAANADEADVGKPSPIGLFAAAIAFVWPLAFSPSLYSPVWAPKSAVAVVVAGVGLPLLIRERSRAGAAAAGFLGVATLSTLLSDNPAMSLFGAWNWGTGLVHVYALVGAWSIGRALSSRDRRLMATSLLISLGVVAVLALCQMAFDLTAFEQPLVFGRSTALQGNPVFLGGALVAGLLLSVHRFASGTRPEWLLLIATFSAAMAVAQGRVSLLIAALAPLVALRLAGVRRAGLLTVAIALGWGLGILLTLISAVPSAPGTRSADPSTAVAVNTYIVREGFGPRVETWITSRHAVIDNPLLGAGPGRFWAATVPHRTLKSTQFSPTTYYSDPHNFAVEYLTTTGVVGLAALAVWILLSARGTRGGEALAAFGILVVHLFQPQNAFVTPLAFLLLGSAAARSVRRPAMAWPSLIGGAVAVVAAGTFLAGHIFLRQAYLDLDQADARAASQLLPTWPEVAEREAIVVANEVVENEKTDWSKVRHHLRRATHLDPADPRFWIRLGGFEQSRRRVEAAEAAYRQALEVEPWSLGGARGMLAVAHAREDPAGSEFWTQRIRLIIKK